MGWTSCHAMFYKPNGQVDRKKECDKLYTWESEKLKVSVVKSAMVGSTYFAAIKAEDKKENTETIEAVMCLTKGVDRSDPWFNFGYKSIPHTDSDNCPMSIIKVLSPAEDEIEAEWRNRCAEYHAKPKLKDLPVGTTIRFINWNGDEYILTKKAPNYMFKKTWWFNAANYTYMPSRRITKWEVINA